MDVKVRFRFNIATGEVEVFDVIDDGPMRLSEAEHNREHDLLAAEVGNVVERNPRVDEVLPGSLPLWTERVGEPEEERVTELPEQNPRQVE
jgi:FtsH ternary system domain X3